MMEQLCDAIPDQVMVAWGKWDTRRNPSMCCGY
jgi:hypothetical protein